MNNLMLDIETLGTGNSAIVISIGAVLFDPHTGEVGAEFYRKLNFQDQIDRGRRPSQGTIEFWFKQDKDAQVVFTEKGVSTEQALNEFKTFVTTNSSYSECKPWGNGPSFDLTIMESLFDDFGILYPWHFRNVRCLRTFKEYVYDGKDLVREGIYHHALDDCKHQIKVVVEGLKRNKPSKPKKKSFHEKSEAERDYDLSAGNKSFGG